MAPTLKPPMEFVPYERPPVLGKWESMKLTCWNSKEGTVLGRTGLSWAKILSFYVVFYSCLCALYAICMQGLFLYVKDTQPYWQLDESLIGSNPGLGFRPISENVDIEGSLIWYKAKNETQCQTWSSRLDTFLQPYHQAPGGGKNRQSCSFDRAPAKDKVCKVEVDKWSPCTSNEGFGFNQSAPCVFLKLNRIYGWTPDYYTDMATLPPKMPEDLKTLIRSSNDSLNTVWLSCRGENPSDRENIGPIEYYPQQGFPGFYFPYLNTPGYLSPLVAVQFLRPTRHILINVECVAWSKNIFYSNTKGIREGSVHFEILID